MIKYKIILFLFPICFGFLNVSYAQIDYQLRFYKCDKNEISPVDYRFHAPELEISDYVTYRKIKCKKPSAGVYNFATNKEVLRVGIKNIFNQKLDTIIELQEGKTEYKLCADQFVDYELKTSLEKSFENKKKWTLQYSLKNENATNQVRKLDESITLTYSWNKIRATHRVGGEEVKKINLNNEQKEALILFEKKLKLMNRTKPNCSISANYYVSTSAEYFQVENKTCLWDGFEELKMELGFK